MHIVSWNCRGLGNPSKAEAVKDLIKLASPNVLLLQETKVDEETILSLSKMKWKKNAGIVVSAWGSSGGLATLWQSILFLWKTPSKLSIGYLLKSDTSQVRLLCLFLICMFLLIFKRKNNVGSLLQIMWM